MSSDVRLARPSPSRAVRAGLVLALASSAAIVQAQTPHDTDVRRFHADDPLWRDPDMRDTPPVADHELSKSYDFLWQHVPRLVARHERTGAQRQHARRGARFELVHQPYRRARADASTRLSAGPTATTDRRRAAGRYWAGPRPASRRSSPSATRAAIAIVIKLDPADCPELPSSVEVISTKIFHALGYHVPEDFIVRFDPADLEPAPDATMRLEGGKRRRFTSADIRQWLKRQPRGADGRIRALASRYVPGRVVGSVRVRRHAVRTIRTTSTPTSAAASCAACACSRRG